MKRLTISVPDEIAAKAQCAVEAREAPSVSAYIADAVAREPDWAAGRAAGAAMIAEIGGLADAEVRAAEERLGIRDEDECVTLATPAGATGAAA
jgi:Arc/MetJ-type ribon-helix-helix transcriptional regulator